MKAHRNSNVYMPNIFATPKRSKFNGIFMTRIKAIATKGAIPARSPRFYIIGV